MNIKQCSVEGCESRHHGKGFCLEHYRKANAEKIKAQMKEYIKKYRKVNAEKLKVYHKDYDKKYYRVNLEKRKAQKKKHYRNNRSKFNAQVAKRRARKLAATPIWLTPAHNEQIEMFYKAALAYQAHVDHIVPLQGKEVCGLHVPWNLQVIDSSSNISKSNKLTKEGEQLAWTSVS